MKPRHIILAHTIVEFAVRCFRLAGLVWVMFGSCFPLFAFGTYPRIHDQFQDHTEGVNRKDQRIPLIPREVGCG